MDNKVNIVDRERFERFLESRKCRKTRERFAVLDAMASCPNHFSIDKLHEELEHRSFHVSLATVYNTVGLLVECGLLRKFQAGEKTFFYERTTVSKGDSRVHLICSVCGKMKMVRDEEMLTLFNSKKYSAFNVSYFTINGYGVCSACSRKQKRMKSQKPKSKTKG